MIQPNCLQRFQIYITVAASVSQGHGCKQDTRKMPTWGRSPTCHKGQYLFKHMVEYID